MLRVTATDVNVNDTLSYKLITGSTDFTVDGNGDITAKNKFDREVWEADLLLYTVSTVKYAIQATSSYQFTVEVSDGVSRPFTVRHYSYLLLPLPANVFTLLLQEQASVHVQITDQNDNRPDFKNTPYSVTLSEVNHLIVLLFSLSVISLKYRAPTLIEQC